MKTSSLFASTLLLASCTLVPLQVTHAASLFKIPATPQVSPVIQNSSLLSFLNGLKLPSNSLARLLQMLPQQISCATSSPPTTTSPGNASAPSSIAFAMIGPANNQHWQLTSTFNDASGVESYTAGGYGNEILQVSTEPVNTKMSINESVDAFIADTHGQYMHNTCGGNITYTGDPATDFACYIQEAKTQGYHYALGQQSALGNS